MVGYMNIVSILMAVIILLLQIQGVGAELPENMEKIPIIEEKAMPVPENTVENSGAAVTEDDYEEEPAAARILILGPDILDIPEEGTNIYDYDAVVLDQYGQPMENEVIVWRLDSPGNGVTVDENTGEVAVDYTVGPGSITIAASIRNSPGVYIQAVMEITLIKV